MLTVAGNEDGTPTEIDFTINDSISKGMNYFIITDTGLYAWGENSSGQVGNGTTENVLTPHKVEGIDGNIEEIIYKFGTVYVLTDSGLYAWGNNGEGSVGNGTTDDYYVLTPYKVQGIEGNIKEIIAGTSLSTVYVITDSGLYIWGDNIIGQVGNGTVGGNVLTPYKAVNGNIKECILRDTYQQRTYVITNDGLYAWGDNEDGDLGNGTTSDTLTPYKVQGIEGNIKELIINNGTVYVLAEDGLYSWGNNAKGQVGNIELNSYYVKYVTTPYKVQIEKQN